MARYMTPDPGQMRWTAASQPHRLTASGNMVHTTQNCPGAAPRNRVNTQGLQEADSIETRGWGDPSLLQGVSLTCLNNSAHWQGTEEAHYSGISSTVPGPVIRRGLRQCILSQGTEFVKEGTINWKNAIKPFKPLPTSTFRCQGSTYSWTLTLGLTPHPAA